MEAAVAAGKKVAFPRCRAEDHSMTFYYASSAADFEKGAYGLQEPLTHLPVFDPEENSGKNVLCVVPAVVYDRRGYRVGYGGGYYDKFIAKHDGAKTVGWCYDFQVVEKDLPKDEWDRRLDALITDLRTIKF
jgi:5-formyltetrahydrofolate cyclo-ligase